MAFNQSRGFSTACKGQDNQDHAIGYKTNLRENIFTFIRLIECHSQSNQIPLYPLFVLEDLLCDSKKVTLQLMFCV